MSSYLHVDSQESVGPLVVSSTLTILLYRTATLCVLPPYIRSLNMLPDLSKSVLSVFLIGDVHFLLLLYKRCGSKQINYRRCTSSIKRDW